MTRFARSVKSFARPGVARARAGRHGVWSSPPPWGRESGLLVLPLQIPQQAPVLSPELQQALKLHQSGRYQEAETIYRQAIAQQPDHPAVPHLLGVLTAQTGRLDEGYDLLRKATERQPRNPEVFNDIGNLTAMLGRLSEAETWLRKAIAIAPNHVGAMASLAKVLQQQERSSEAEACAKVVLRAAPGRPDMLNVLALGHYFRHRLAEAEQACREGLARAPNDADLHNTLGLILRDCHRLDESVAAFEKAIELQPKNAMPLYNLGICHHQRSAYARAETCFRTVLERQPQNENAKYCLGEAIVAQGRTAEGRRILDDVLQRDGRNWLVRWSRLLTLPIIYANQAQIEETRADFDRQLAALEADTPLHPQTDLPNILRGAQYKTDFLLHYQGRNDVALQRRFGGLIARIAEAAYPAHAQPIARRKRAPGERLRVGFASAHFYSHSVAKTHGAWITELPRDRFSVSLFHLFAQADETTERLKRNATYHACGTLSQEELVARIAAERLDVLIWLDIGMEARAQIPSALRLAPVQATTWGHPVTSGLPNIDYYLSSEGMEPPDADSHYSERLVRLPNLSVAYPRPPARWGSPPARVSKLKADGQTLFLCAQSLFKLVPEHDDIFPAIARVLPDAAFLFIAHKEQYATQIFSDRLYRAFAAAGLSSDNRVYILPRLSQEDFFALNREADVVLDSIGWAGCNSTLEALACDKPVVTLAGETMRARHGLAILGMIGMTELIARNKAQYVEIATRLGRDPVWRQEIAARIAARKDALYGDRTPLDALAEWLESATRDG